MKMGSVLTMPKQVVRPVLEIISLEDFLSQKLQIQVEKFMMQLQIFVKIQIGIFGLEFGNATHGMGLKIGTMVVEGNYLLQVRSLRLTLEALLTRP